MLSVFPPPSFIKIDVEGAEQTVLEGARKLLEQFRPKLYIEVGAQHVDGVSELLQSFDYQFFNGARALSGQQPRSRCVFNTLAIPKHSGTHKAFAA